MLSTNLKKLRRERGLTLEELAEAIGSTRQTVHRYEKGLITNIPPEKVELLARRLGVSPAELLGWEDEASPSDFGGNYNNKGRVPMLGEIACGEPILAEEVYEDLYEAGDGIAADFCLRAHGDSMIGARIYDGDVVFIRSQGSVENGQIAAVIIGDEATLKRVYYYPEEEKLVLSPENPRYAPLVYVGEELGAVRILGLAVAFRSKIF